jgi:DNA-binding CsgD family transcriptional regulator
VKDLIREQPTASNRRIADQAGCSHTTVAKVRTELYAELAAERAAGEG